MSRLTIDVTESQHQALKATAALQGKTIKEYALGLLFPSAFDEEQALEALKVLLSHRMAEAQRGDVVDRSITEVAGEVLAAGRPV